MIYLIGGTARSGKSTLLHEILKEKGCMGISTDAITQMLDVGMPEIGINFEMAPHLRAEKLLPLIIGLCTYHADKIDLVIEGEAIIPQNYSIFEEYSHGNLKMLCIGNSYITPQKKVKNIKQFQSYNEWTNNLDDQELLKLAEELILHSQQIEKDCKQFSIPYFDTSEDFLGTIQKAKIYLLN